MKKVSILCLLLCFIFSFGGCDLLGSPTGSPKPEEIDVELQSATGKWTLLDDDDTFFNFDGSKNVMTFNYVEDGTPKYNGTFRVVYRGLGKDVATPLCFIFTRTDKEKEDWLNCYVENFDTDFSQFTIFGEEEDLGMIDASLYTHIYRISEMPYKMGAYVLEGHEYKTESNDYKYADNFHIPTGTYSLPTGESFYFLAVKPCTHELFQYRNGDTLIEGSFWIAEDKNTIYLYIENDPYSKVTNADKDKYDTTFDIYYPPDFYLRGYFSNSDNIVINDLYHHTYSPTDIQDSTWVFGTYVAVD